MYEVEYTYRGQRGQELIIATEKEIRNKFYSEGKTIINIKKQSRLKNKKPTKQEIIATFTALGDMLNAGKKMLESINAVILSFKKNSPMIPILQNVHERIKNGKQLSACLKEYTPIFGTTTITMIESGEKAGKLPETLKSISAHIEKIEKTKKEMLSGLASPLFTLFVGLVSLFISTTFVIPKITKSFSQVGQQGGNTFFLNILSSLSWIVPLVILVIVILIIIGIAQFKSNQKQAEDIIARIPLLQELVFSQAYYVVFSSLSNMLSVGIRLQNALPIVASSTKLITIRKELEDASELIRRGQYNRFADAFKTISTIERTMLETAQQEDAIQLRFKNVSDRFYNSYIDKLKIIGPTVKYLVMGLVVGLIILMFLGIMLPYLSMMQSIK